MTDIAAVPAIAFVGAGALGQIFAALLAQSGQPVTLLARLGTATQLLAAGAIRLRGAVDVAVSVAEAPAPAGQVGITADPARLPDGAGLIFLTKAHDLPEAIAAVRAVWPRPHDSDAWVAGFQNGLQKDDLLAAAFGAERVVAGATILSGQRGADGTVTVTSLGATYLGELADRDSPRVAAAIAALMRAGIPTEAPAALQAFDQRTLRMSAGVFGVSALARIPGSLILADQHFARVYLTLVRETAAVGAAYGVEVGNYERFPPMRTYVTQPDAVTLAAIPTGPLPRGGSIPSMTQDLLANNPMEVEGVFGDLVARAERVGIAVPYLTFARDLLRGIDRVVRESQ